MAKAQNKGGQKSAKQVWEGPKMSIQDAKDIIKAFCVESVDHRHRWSGQDVAVIPVLMGEAGIGKTGVIKSLAKELGYDFTRIPTGDVELEDNLGIPTTQSPLDEVKKLQDIIKEVQSFPNFDPKQVVQLQEMVISKMDALNAYLRQESHTHASMAPPHFPVNEPESEFGIVLLDEVFSASPRQQNQVRQMISDRTCGNLRIAPRWLLVATTNPVENKYLTMQTFDHAIESRMLILPVEADIEVFLEHCIKHNLLDSKTRGFILMNKALWEAADPRRWVSWSDKYVRFKMAGLSTDLIFKLMSNFLGDEVTNQFSVYDKKGDDPKNYPIPGKDLIEADGPTHTRQRVIYQHWKDHSQTALIAATALDLRLNMRNMFSNNKSMTDAQANNIAKFVDSSTVDIAQTILEACGNGTNGAKILQAMSQGEMRKELSRMTADVEKARSARKGK